MRLNPVAAVRDWSAKRKMKEVLISLLRNQPPGAGVEVPTRWCGTANCACLPTRCTKAPDTGPLWAAAAMDLVRAHPAITVVRMREGLALCKRTEIDASLSAPLKQSMSAAGALPQPGDDLNDSLD